MRDREEGEKKRELNSLFVVRLKSSFGREVRLRLSSFWWSKLDLPKIVTNTHSEESVVESGSVQFSRTEPPVSP